MALVKFDASSEQYKFLQGILDNSEQILKEYNRNKHNLNIMETNHCLGWWITMPYRFGFEEESKQLPTLSDILTPIKNLTTVMISDVNSNLPQGIHVEDLPKSVRRFHIPIKHNPNARLNVLEDNVWNAYEWNENDVFEFTNFYDPHYISCPGNAGNRIVVMVDLFEGDITDKQLNDIKQWYDNWETSVNYHQVKKA